MINTKILEDIGLTKSEVKVYIALLKLGSSTKRDIVKESKISSSKLYEITDKLISKGLVSYVKKNKVTNFSAAPPEQVLDFIQRKKNELSDQEKEFSLMIPQLKSLEKKEEPEIEVFKGWEGLRTVERMMLKTLKKGDTDYVFGATEGENPEMARKIFTEVHKERIRKGINLKIILDKKSKDWAFKILDKDIKYNELRFTNYSHPAEVNVCKNNVSIIILTDPPVITLIKSKVAAQSFLDYFNALWKTASKG